jgi:hypothetical protein
MNDDMKLTDLYDQSDERIEYYETKAREMLIESAWIPLSDDAWTDDKYEDMIAKKAQELWDNDQI